MDGHDSEDPKQSADDMSVYCTYPVDSGISVKMKQPTFSLAVHNLLGQMQSRFQTMSETIVSKLDEMASRVTELERSINDLKTEMEVEASPSPSTPTNVKSEEVKNNEGSG